MWKLFLKGRTLTMRTSDWIIAAAQYGKRNLNTTDFEYRCNVWTQYVGAPVIDWEWID